jgi:tetratricopeptide (TPR) repeat protein
MVSDPEGQTPIHTLDAHPVVRQHFGRRLKEDAPDAFREANRRLYEHYKALPEKLYGKELPDTLEEMQPLFFAIAHGCAARMHYEAWRAIYLRCIQRSGRVNYTMSQLGAVNADLGALTNFFDSLWDKPSASLPQGDQAAALNYAGFRLRALGRSREAVEPMQADTRLAAEQQDWTGAAAAASNLSELLLTLGDVGPAVAAAREAVAYADKTRDPVRRMISLTTLADALHQAGDTREAEIKFAEAERLQKEFQPALPRLYSQRGYRFCDLLLRQGRHAEVAERAEYAIKVAQQDKYLVSIALDTLSLGRAAHQAWRAARTAAGVPSPLVGEGQGGGDRRTSPAGSPPTPVQPG